jgi:NAD(P)H dehydrogenase (quinone)
MEIAIVYDSGWGHTAALAEAAARGVSEVSGVKAHLVAVSEGFDRWELLERCDGIIFGSPTYNGMISAKLKQFFEDSTKQAWNDFKWKDKVAAGFTNSGAHSGDKLNSLVSMALVAAQHGMIWVGVDLKPGNSSSTGSVDDLNRLGSWIGAMAQSNVDQGPDVAPVDSDRRTVAHLGKRVAEVAVKLSRQGLARTPDLHV